MLRNGDVVASLITSDTTPRQLIDHMLGREVSLQVTEQIARGFYRRWASYMRGADWNELLGSPVASRQAAE